MTRLSAPPKCRSTFCWSVEAKAIFSMASLRRFVAVARNVGPHFLIVRGEQVGGGEDQSPRAAIADPGVGMGAIGCRRSGSPRAAAPRRCAGRSPRRANWRRSGRPRARGRGSRSLRDRRRRRSSIGRSARRGGARRGDRGDHVARPCRRRNRSARRRDRRRRRCRRGRRRTGTGNRPSRRSAERACARTVRDRDGRKSRDSACGEGVGGFRPISWSKRQSGTPVRVLQQRRRRGHRAADHQRGGRFAHALDFRAR